MNPDAFIVIGLMPGIGQNKLWIRIFDLKQGIILTFKGLRPRYIVTYLDIHLFIAADGNKIHFFLIQLSNVNPKPRRISSMQTIFSYIRP